MSCTNWLPSSGIFSPLPPPRNRFLFAKAASESFLLFLISSSLSIYSNFLVKFYCFATTSQRRKEPRRGLQIFCRWCIIYAIRACRLNAHNFGRKVCIWGARVDRGRLNFALGSIGLLWHIDGFKNKILAGHEENMILGHWNAYLEHLHSGMVSCISRTHTAYWMKSALQNCSKDPKPN